MRAMSLHRSDRALPLRGMVRWFGRRPLLADSCLAVFLAVATGADILHRGAPTAVALQAALWLPVVFRRTAPVSAFTLVGVIAAVQWAVSEPLGGDLSVLMMLYTVAAHRGWKLAVAAAGAVEIGVVLAVIRFAGDGWPRFLLLLTVLVFAALFLGITQQSRRSHLAELVSRADRVEREAEQQAQLAAAAERTRIAREMHDIVAHSLSVMVALADGAALTDQPEQARSAMRQVARTGREALADTRRVLDVLRTDPGPAERAPLPGLDAMEALLTTVRATGLHTSLLVTGNVFAVPEAGQTAIYRIVQEALTNTIKHARQADQATVRLSYSYPLVDVEIIDNGTREAGRPDPAPAGGAHGLLGIRERAALFGGDSRAGWSAAGGGWRVTVTLRFPDVAGQGDAAGRGDGGRHGDVAEHGEVAGHEVAGQGEVAGHGDAADRGARPAHPSPAVTS